MPEEVRTCPLCTCSKSRPFAKVIFRGRPASYRSCSHCDLVHQSPRLTGDELTAFYATEYRLFQEGSADPTGRNLRAQEARAAALLEFARQHLPAVGRHLDIGCSLGILLQAFQDHYQDQGVGVEPGESHRAHASRQGLTVFASLQELERSEAGRFDLVSMSHVLEHMPDPVGTLAHLREKVLSPEGHLLVEVPNLYAHDSLEPAHLFAFSPHSLRQVLGAGGFEIIHMERHGRPSSALLPLFLTVLCKPAAGENRPNIVAERGVKARRVLGMFWRRLLGRLLPRQAWLPEVPS